MTAPLKQVGSKLPPLAEAALFHLSEESVPVLHNPLKNTFLEHTFT